MAELDRGGYRTAVHVYELYGMVLSNFIIMFTDATSWWSKVKWYA